MSAVLLAVVLLPALPAVACLLAPARVGDRAGRLGAGAAALALGAAVVLAVRVVGAGPVSTDPGPVGLAADRLSVVLLVLVLGVSAVVQLFVGRYLSGDPRQPRLVAAAGVTTAAAAALVTAATLAVLLVAWLASGLGLLAMLAQRADLPQARVGLRRTAAAFACGDLALVVAVVLTWSTVGEVDLRRVEEHAAALAAAPLGPTGVGVGTVVACLLVVAAIGRCALVPLHRWLPATLAAPTPVSAFLHAGLVNAGGILLVRLGPVFAGSAVATHLAFAVGAVTAVWGTALMLAKPDVKGALAHSTIGQMGFMVMACALGALAAAIFHLVAHGMYKATLFLGADSAVHGAKRRAAVPRPAPAGAGWPAPARLAAAALVPAAALAAAVATFAAPVLEHGGAVALLAFAWASAAHAGWGWLGATPARPAAGLVALTGACAAYAGLVAAATAFLAPALPADGPGARFASPWLVVLPAAALVALHLVGERRRAALYVRALDAGHVAAADGRRARRVRPPVPAPVPVLVHPSPTPAPEHV